MKALGPGASFALIAPSSCTLPESTEKGIALLRGRGLNPIPHPKLYEGFEGYGGTVEGRVQAVHWAFAESGADAVLCVRGGYGAIQLLEYINYELIRQNPKPFIGYSDITSLHMAFIAQAGLKTVHGPMLGPDIAGKPAESTDLLLDFLGGKPRWPSFQVLREGKAEGILLGGNLAVFMSSLGSPHMPNLKGCILFLEDVGEAAYRIDRMLRTLRHSGVLGQCAGILFGDFTEKGDDLGEGSAADYRAYVRRAFLEATRGIDIPIVYGVSSGHCTPNYPLPLGARVCLDTSLGFTLGENFFDK